MTRPTGEDEMIDMTDERAAEVLAAHNEWRRYKGDPFDPGAPEMGDPAEIGRAIDHAVSRLRSQPPAEAQPEGGDLLPCPMCGESAAVNTCRTNDREFIRLNKRDTGYGVNCIACGLNNRGVAYGYATAGEAIAGWNRRTAPPSAPEGVECAPIRYFAYDSDCGDYNEFDTLPEAIADAQEALDCAGDDGWPEGGPSIYYGAVLGEAREVEGSRRPAGPGDHPDADFIVEYELKGSDALSQQPAAEDGAAVRWAVERWNDEVANRPLVNVYRRTLDGTWRQVIRHFGGDDVTLCGPRHDDLAAQQGGRSDD